MLTANRDQNTGSFILHHTCKHDSTVNSVQMGREAFSNANQYKIRVRHTGLAANSTEK